MSFDGLKSLNKLLDAAAPTEKLQSATPMTEPISDWQTKTEGTAQDFIDGLPRAIVNTTVPSVVPIAWIAYRAGEVPVHFSKVDGWSVEVVAEGKAVPSAIVALDADKVADETVNEWNAAGKMPPMAWDFRGLVAAGIRRALDGTGHAPGK